MFDCDYYLCCFDFGCKLLDDSCGLLVGYGVVFDEVFDVVFVVGDGLLVFVVVK